MRRETHTKGVTLGRLVIICHKRPFCAYSEQLGPGYGRVHFIAIHLTRTWDCSQLFFSFFLCYFGLKSGAHARASLPPF